MVNLSKKTARDSATANLLDSFNARRSRGALLKGALATGLAVGGAGLLPALPVRAASGGEDDESEDKMKTIFSIARTAEQLAITFYSNGVMNAATMGLKGMELDQIKAALIEEQIHQQFFTANHGQSLADTFSFPDGAQTFMQLKLFIKAQQQLEGAFDSAFIAAVEEFAAMGRPDLARIACQIAMIESEHRALGRDIAHLPLADNWTFAPKLIEAVGDAPEVLMQAGYLSPQPGNSYTYHQVTFDDPTNDPLGLYGVAQLVQYKTGPFAAPEDGEDGENRSKSDND